MHDDGIVCIQYVGNATRAHMRTCSRTTRCSAQIHSSYPQPVAVTQLQLSSCSYPVAGIHAQNTDTALLSTDCGHQVRIFGYPILYCIPILYDQYMRTRVHTVPVWTDSHCTCTCTYQYWYRTQVHVQLVLYVELYRYSTMYSTKSPY